MKGLPSTAVPCVWIERNTTKVVFDKFVKMPLENVPLSGVKTTSLRTCQPSVRATVPGKHGSKSVQEAERRCASTKKNKRRASSVFPCQDEVCKRAKYAPFSSTDLQHVLSLAKTDNLQFDDLMKALLTSVKGKAASVGWGKKYGA